MMGVYLSHLRNQKEDPRTGRVPDENFAREVMQLFSIGLYQLNTDGTREDQRNGQPIEPTGRPTSPAWRRCSPASAGPAPTGTDQQLLLQRLRRTASATADRSVQADARLPAVPLAPRRRPSSARRSRRRPTADPRPSLKTALDTLFNHPNVGPFIGKQLIQRLVTSNPSPAYVARVAAAFNNNGSGVRGDMKAVVKAVLLRPRGAHRSAEHARGKLREPVLRLSALAARLQRQLATPATTRIGNTDNPAHVARPDAAALADGVQLLPARLRAARHRAPRRRASRRPRCRSRTRPGRRLRELHARCDRQRRRRQHERQRRNRRDLQPDFAAEIALADNPARWSIASTPAAVRRDAGGPEEPRSSGAVDTHRDPGADIEQRPTRPRSTRQARPRQRRRLPDAWSSPDSWSRNERRHEATMIDHNASRRLFLRQARRVSALGRRRRAARAEPGGARLGASRRPPATTRRSSASSCSAATTR